LACAPAVAVAWWRANEARVGCLAIVAGECVESCVDEEGVEDS
jgi:hypothetical protein